MEFLRTSTSLFVRLTSVFLWWSALFLSRPPSSWSRTWQLHVWLVLNKIIAQVCFGEPFPKQTHCVTSLLKWIFSTCYNMWTVWENHQASRCSLGSAGHLSSHWPRLSIGFAICHTCRCGERLTQLEAGYAWKWLSDSSSIRCFTPSRLLRQLTGCLKLHYAPHEWTCMCV